MCSSASPRLPTKKRSRKAAEARGKHVKQSGGRGQFGDCTIRIEPFTAEQAKEEELKWEDNFAFENKVFGGSIPKEYIPSDRVRLPHGRQDRRAGELSADQRQGDAAGRQLPRRSTARRSPSSSPARSPSRTPATRPALTLLEPIMKVVVTTPEDFVGNVVGDLNKRRGMINSSDQRGNTRIVEAEVPLSEMFGYTTELRSMSTGRASSVMEPLKYAPVPNNVKNAILEELG